MATRRSKKDRPQSITAKVLAENVTMLRDYALAALPNETARNKKLAELVDCSTSHMQRICASEVAIGIDLLERLALALGVSPTELLTPNYAAQHAREVLRMGKPTPAPSPPAAPGSFGALGIEP